jgi:Secretion system C-terminal sorting domain
MKKLIFLSLIFLLYNKVYSQPPSFSWGNNISSQDQLQQGPCQVFAVVAALEGWQALLYGNVDPLSHAHLFSGCVGGSPLGVEYALTLPFLKNFGIVTKDFLPYITSCNNRYPCPACNYPCTSVGCYYNNGLNINTLNFIDKGTPWKNCTPNLISPNESLPDRRYKIGDYEILSNADYATAEQLKLSIINYGPIPIATDKIYPVSHGLCLYGWDAQGNWLASDSWPTNDPISKILSIPISTNITTGNYFVAYRLKKSIDGKPAIYKQIRIPNPSVFNNWVDDIQPIVPITTNNSLNDVFKIVGPQNPVAAGTYSIPGLQYLTNATIEWAYQETGSSIINTIPNTTGNSVVIPFSANTTLQQTLIATITWPNGIKVKVVKMVQPVSFTISKNNFCLGNTSRQITYWVTANPQVVNFLLDAKVMVGSNSTVTSSWKYGNTFSFIINSSFPNSCGVFLYVYDGNGVKIGERTDGLFLASCGGSPYKAATSILAFEDTHQLNLITKNIDENFSINPNPAKDKLYIQTKNKNYNIQLIDIYGRIIKTATMINIYEMNISKLAKGIYFIHFIANDKRQNNYVKQFLKQ